MTKFIVIANAKGGVGKTTTAINLAHALNQFGRETIVVDANFETPNVNLMLGSSSTSYTLIDALDGSKKISDVVYQHTSGLKIIPSTISLEKLKTANYDNLADTLIGLHNKVEVVIIDSGSGLDEKLISTLKIADHVILVTNPEIHAVTDALKTVKLIHENGIHILGVVINKDTPDKFKLTPHNIEAILEKPILGIIPDDPAVKRSIHYKHPVTYSHPNSSAAVAFKKIAAKLIGEKYEANLEIKEKESSFNKVLKKLGF